MKESVKDAIELGKIWMKNSLDPIHDFEHASRVEEHALNIYHELRPKDVSEEALKLAIWWHDAYKARLPYPTMESNFTEGDKSAEIFHFEVGKSVDFLTSNQVAKAIRLHCKPLNFLLFNRNDTLSRILIEADQIEGLNKDRKKKYLRSLRNPILYILGKFLAFAPKYFLLLIRPTQYTRRIIKNLN